MSSGEDMWDEPDQLFRGVSALSTDVAGVLTFRDELDLDPPYQRGYVWTERQKAALIESLYRGFPVPPIVVNRHWRNPITTVIDGKQRIRAIYDFVDGELEVGGKRWPQLTDVQRRIFRGAQLPTIRLQDLSLRQEAVIYHLLLSAGTEHTEEERVLALAFAQSLRGEP